MEFKLHEFIIVALLIFILGALATVLGLSNYLEKEIRASAPFDRISNKEILFYQDKVCINVSNTSLTSYANTGSMRPTLGGGANGVVIEPKNENDIHLGDIVSYDVGKENLIVHRVVEIGNDINGTYFVTKGDSNKNIDGKIRFSQIRHLLVVVVYLFRILM